jgi:hypothetical protein
MSLFRPDIAIDPFAQALVHRWTAALRGGEFRQASGRLRTGDAWCCLGVACHTYEPRDWRLVGDRWSYQGEPVELPREVADAYRLRSTVGRYGLHLDARSLALDNDEGRSFAELADLIDRELVAAIARRQRRERRQ